MKRSTGPILLTCLTVAAVFAGCSDDPPPQSNPPIAGSGGSSTAGTPGTMAGTTSAGTAGSFNTAGSEAGGAGGTGGSGGATAGGGAGGTTAGTAGTGGTPEPITPTVVLIDNVRLQLKPGVVEGGEGGAGGAGGAGAGGESAGGVPAAGAGGEGLGGEAAVGGSGGEGGDAGELPHNPGLHGFYYTFDANVMPFAFNGGGWSPGPGGSGGPSIQNASTLMHDATMGNPGGAVKLSVPFTVATQQGDIGGPLAGAPVNLAGYELLAEVKLLDTGLATDCVSAWMYVWGGTSGYANDASAEPAMLETQPLVRDEWVTVRLDLDGPYGAHTTTFTPDGVQIWGVQLNTWGCP